MAKAGRPRNHDPIADKIRQAIKYDTLADVKKLIGKSKLDVPDGESATPLMHAAVNDKPDILSWLISKGADLNLQDRNGYTALHYASHAIQLEIVSNLIKSDAKIDIQDFHGNTPLWYATFNSRGDYRLVELLKKHGANSNIKNSAGRSPLDFASQIGDERLVGILKNA